LRDWLVFVDEKMDKKERLQKEIDLIQHSEKKDLSQINLLVAIFIPTIIAVFLIIIQFNLIVYWVGITLAILFTFFFLSKYLKPGVDLIRSKHELIRDKYMELGIDVLKIDEELKKKKK